LRVPLEFSDPFAQTSEVVVVAARQDTQHFVVVKRGSRELIPTAQQEQRLIFRQGLTAACFHDLVAVYVELAVDSSHR
jgi:hypothetical protein